MIRVHSAVFFSSAFLLLILPLRWILGAVLAGLIHELGHIAALWLVSGKIKNIHVHIGGCEIETEPLNYRQEFCSVLAGPVGSFLLLFFRKVAPEAAVCGVVQGLYNLIPVWPLDGGRLLQILLYKFLPNNAELVMTLSERLVYALLLAFIVIIIVRQRTDKGFIILAAVWFFKMVSRKTPCKPFQFKVQ